MTDDRVALFRHVPRLAARVPMAPLGQWPTPLDEITVAGRPLWVKREGESSPLYGGNKVRTLEAWLGHTQASGAKRIWAIGAYGSNHAVATVLHARSLGLDAGAIVFPQPASAWAIENAGALIASGCPLVRLRNVVEVPFAGGAIAAGSWLQRVASPEALLDRASSDPTRWSAIEARLRRALASLVGDSVRDSIVMPPGGATPIGTIGALSAAFELAEQIAAGVAPPPARIVLAVGSTCTTAGLVAGLALAHAVGAWRWPVPIVHAVRVTPWPVTSRFMILQLAAATLARIASLGGPRVELGSDARLVVDRRELGRGYGRLTARAGDAMTALARDASRPLRLDGVYSGKAAAALLRLHREGVGPLVFWATKSTVELPRPSTLRGAPRALVRWLG